MKRAPWVFACIVAATVSTGCVTQQRKGDGFQYWKENMDYSQRLKDINQCDYESTLATASYMNVWDKPFQQNEVMHKCMVAKGYTLL